MKTTLLMTAFAVSLTFGASAFAQAQDSSTVMQSPEAVHTYHSKGTVVAPDGTVVPVTSETTTTQSVTVETTPKPAVAYPDKDIEEPVAIGEEGVSVPKTVEETSHQTVIEKKKVYEDGKLQHESEIHHTETVK